MLWLLALLPFGVVVPVRASTCQGTLSPNNQCNYYGLLVLGPLCDTVVQCTANGWQQCLANGANPCVQGGPVCSPGCVGKLWSTALATCNVLGITDPATCNNTFVSNGEAGGIWQFSQCVWGDNDKCNQATSFCPYDIDLKYSSDGFCTPVPSGNVCWPADDCNVCAQCCQSYLTDQSACDGCVAQNCPPPPPPTNVCWPAEDCNVCSACCQSYLTDQSACDGCVAQECGGGNEPVCWPQADCTSCSACCQSYLTDPSACGGCVQSACTSDNSSIATVGSLAKQEQEPKRKHLRNLFNKN